MTELNYLQANLANVGLCNRELSCIQPFQNLAYFVSFHAVNVDK